MAEPFIAGRKPIITEMNKGTYYWCKCGLSKEQPFCDGSHKTTEFTPIEFEVKEQKKFALCQCKQSKNPPYCDGSHARISA